MPGYSDYIRTRIVLLKEAGHGVSSIAKVLLTEDNITVTRRGIYKHLKRWGEGFGLADRPKAGRPAKFTEIHKNVIDEEMTQNKELVAKDLREILKERTGLEVSLASVKRMRRKLGWIRSRKGYCQLVKLVNRPKRVQWCKEALVVEDKFEDVIWTDECTVQMDSHGRFVFRKVVYDSEGNDISEPPPLRAKVKHPYKVHVWAGISKRGATKIAIFSGLMNSDSYIQILNDYLIPFIKTSMPNHHRFQQDNAPQHTSRKTKGFLKENAINWFQTPPESPDLNPIENIWSTMKHHLRKYTKPKTKDELISGMQEFWKTVTTEECIKYINHINKVIPEVLKREGRASGY